MSGSSHLGASTIATFRRTHYDCSRICHRATFRGTLPQDDLSVRAVEGLKADGLAVPSGKPSPINDKDVAGATHIFANRLHAAGKALASGKSTDWSDVPDDHGYAPMRDAIGRHVKTLPDDLGR